MVHMPEKYSWSSYQYYIGNKKKPDWLTVDFILCYFDNDNVQARKRDRNLPVLKELMKSPDIAETYKINQFAMLMLLFPKK